MVLNDFKLGGKIHATLRPSVWHSWQILLVSSNSATCSPIIIWVFPKIGVSQNGWFIMENPIKWMIWGYHYFRKHPYPSSTVVLDLLLLPPPWNKQNRQLAPPAEKALSNRMFFAVSLSEQLGLFFWGQADFQNLSPGHTAGSGLSLYSWGPKPIFLGVAPTIQGVGMERWPSHGGRGLDLAIWSAAFRAFCCSLSGYSCIEIQ